jgi:hypothetical protein
MSLEILKKGEKLISIGDKKVDMFIIAEGQFQIHYPGQHLLIEPSKASSSQKSLTLGDELSTPLEEKVSRRPSFRDSQDSGFNIIGVNQKCGDYMNLIGKKWRYGEALSFFSL